MHVSGTNAPLSLQHTHADQTRAGMHTECRADLSGDGHRAVDDGGLHFVAGMQPIFLGAAVI